MKDFIQALNELASGYESILRIARTPPAAIEHQKDKHMGLNLSALIVSTFLFFIARAFVSSNPPGSGAGFFETVLIQAGVAISAVFCIFAIYTVVILFSRDGTVAQQQADQWGTHFIFVWMFSLIFFILDSSLATYGQMDTIVTRISRQVPVSWISMLLIPAIYSTLAYGVVLLKSVLHRKPEEKKHRVWLSAIIAIVANTLLFRIFVFGFKDL